MLKYVVLLSGFVLLSITPARAGLSDAQRKSAIDASAARIMAKCNRAGSEYRKCYSHLSKGQCRSIMKKRAARCKSKVRKLTRSFRSAPDEPNRIQRRAIALTLEICFMEPFIERHAKNKKKAFYCMKRNRH